jgi:DHA1 family bicyclomycin/chloramphenicol resistance-like MFS transporter
MARVEYVAASRDFCPMTPASTVPRGRIAALLAGLAMFGPFAIDTMFPAFPAMAVSLGVTDLAMQQTLSVYLLAYAGMALLHGPFSDAYGRKRVILVGTAMFTLASVGCALAPTLEWLLAFRALQGISAGVGIIVGRAIIRDLYQGPDAQRLMATVTMIFGIAPAIAPIIGGWIFGFGDWHAIFWFLCGFGVLIWLACLVLLPETHPHARRVPLSVDNLWRTYTVMVRDPTFRRLSFSTGFNFGALFLYISSAPAFVMTHLGMGTMDFGWFFVPTIVGMMAGAFTSGRLAGRVSPERCVGMAYAVMLVACVCNVAYSISGLPFQLPWAVLPIAVIAFGIAIAFPAMTLMLLDRYPDHRGAASSLQSFFSLVLNALVAGAIAPWLNHATQWLAIGALTLTVLGYVAWQMRPRPRDEPVPPTDVLPLPNEGQQ